MTASLIPAIMVDLDGTLYACDERRKKYLDIPKPDFDGFNRAAVEDKANYWCVALCQAMSEKGCRLIFVTGREAPYQGTTKMWLEHWGLPTKANGGAMLLMRAEGDFRPDEEIKAELYKSRVAAEHQVLFVVDDRRKVVKMWRSLGLLCLHCAEGDF